jgi:hypothetical protein
MISQGGSVFTHGKVDQDASRAQKKAEEIHKRKQLILGMRHNKTMMFYFVQRDNNTI